MADSQFEERAVGRVNRVAKVVKGGRRFSFAALMVIGDGNGQVGLGYGKAKEAGLAMQKAVEEAKKNLFAVPLAGSTITHPILGETAAGRVVLKPDPPPADRWRARRPRAAAEAGRPRYGRDRRRRGAGHPRGGRDPRRGGQVA